MRPKPDWDRFEALGAEVERLQAAGLWTEAEFRRVLKETEEAIGDAGEGTECVLNHAEPEWLERLDAEITPSSVAPGG
jgi:hypothetical protein